MHLNRISGLGAVFLGVLLMAWIIPGHTEAVEYGWLGPATLPDIAAAIIILAGGIHFIFPRGKAKLEFTSAWRAGLFLGLGIFSIWLMDKIGFLATAPFFMLVLMLAVGERRWKWLIIGSLGLPAVIWFCVDFLLKRPLP